jgi:hypothetical protein
MVIVLAGSWGAGWSDDFWQENKRTIHTKKGNIVTKVARFRGKSNRGCHGVKAVPGGSTTIKASFFSKRLKHFATFHPI